MIMENVCVGGGFEETEQDYELTAMWPVKKNLSVHCTLTVILGSQECECQSNI